MLAVINLKTIYYHGSKQERTQRTRDTHLVHYPALQQKGWAVSVNMREEYYFTDDRVLVVGNQHSVAEGKKADYLLYHKGKPIAVVEAKDNKHAVGGGIQQAMEYAQILDLKFAYSCNGDAFLEHDFITGKETEIKVRGFSDRGRTIQSLSCI